MPEPGKPQRGPNGERGESQKSPRNTMENDGFIWLYMVLMSLHFIDIEYPLVKHTKNYGKIHHAIDGKTHYFYDHVQ